MHFHTHTHTQTSHTHTQPHSHTHTLCPQSCHLRGHWQNKLSGIQHAVYYTGNIYICHDKLCVCVCACVCVHACVHVRVHAFTCRCACVCTHACMRAWVCIWMCVFVFVSVFVCVYVCESWYADMHPPVCSPAFAAPQTPPEYAHCLWPPCVWVSNLTPPFWSLRCCQRLHWSCLGLAQTWWPWPTNSISIMIYAWFGPTLQHYCLFLRKEINFSMLKGDKKWKGSLHTWSPYLLSTDSQNNLSCSQKQSLHECICIVHK